MEVATFTTSDGLRLAYRIDDFTDPWRTPDTLILKHAAMGSMNRMYAWVPILARHFRVIRMDMRGHGNSEIPPEGGITLERLARDVVELMDEVCVASAHLAGSSAGGIIAMWAAIVHRERVKSLASYATIPGLKMSAGRTDYQHWIDSMRREGIAAFLRRTAADRFDLDAVDPGFLDWFIAEAARNDVEMLARIVTLMSGTDFQDRIHEISYPSLMVVPGCDPNQSAEEYNVLKRIPDCIFKVYEGLPHNITDAVAERCATDLRDFLLTHAG
jgi:3-oxoadipate enol-lactonase